MKRYKESSKKRNKTFGKTASKTHWKNVSPRPMRGGIRM